jgi:tetratricopeptide (TPR) repeat protein
VGDALEHYQEAVAADSQFTLAAIRGAEAATWEHDNRAARALIALALAHRGELEPRLAAFTGGYAAYLDGKPEAAVAGLREAIAIDPRMAVAWWALGETYTHLLPRRGPVDSLAEASLDEAHRLDSTAVYAVYHLLEIAIRKGERVRAERLARAFEAAEPDSALAAHVRIMRTCAFDGAGAVDWAREVQAWARQVVSAGRSLAAGGSQLACAERAFSAVLAGDTASDSWGVGRRWGAVVGLQSLLVVRGQAAAVERLLDSAVQHGMPAAAALYLLDAAVGADLGRRAAEVATRDAERWGAEYRGNPYRDRLWLLALWEASRGRAEQVAAIADELQSRADTGGSRSDSLLARAVRAHAALAGGDSAEALRQFGELVPTAPGDELVWELAEPLAVERLVLMRLLMASGRMAEALEVGAVFDSPVPLIHLLFVRESLELRLEAARAMAYEDLARRLSGRLERVQAYRSEP